MQIWAEALRRPPLQEHARTLYLEARDRLTELAVHWQADGHLPPGSDPAAAASVVFTPLMHGLIVCHHLAEDVPLGDLQRGLAALGAAPIG